MPIDTDFRFNHAVNSPGNTNILDPARPADADILGSLRRMVGGSPGDGASRLWKGNGFNMIWRPNFGGQSGPVQHFLQLNMIDETFSVKDVSGANGIANRSLFETDIFLGGIAYTQEINDSFDNSGQHFEPGVFNHVPPTTNPSEPATIVRMGSIPHGTTINMQGVADVIAGAPQIDPVSITAFVIGDPGRLVRFDEENLSIPLTSRTDLARVASLTQAQLDDPNLFLRQALEGQTIERTTVIKLTTSANDPMPPSVGGGAANIAFLEGTGSGPNADVPLATSTFWIEEGTDAQGNALLQMQYSQMVLLDFSGLSWPHITVATLRAA